MQKFSERNSRKCVSRVSRRRALACHRPCAWPDTLPPPARSPRLSPEQTQTIQKQSNQMPRKPIVGGNWKCNPAEIAKLPELVKNINDCDTSKQALMFVHRYVYAPLAPPSSSSAPASPPARSPPTPPSPPACRIIQYIHVCKVSPFVPAY